MGLDLNLLTAGNGGGVKAGVSVVASSATSSVPGTDENSPFAQFLNANQSAIKGSTNEDTVVVPALFLGPNNILSGQQGLNVSKGLSKNVSVLLESTELSTSLDEQDIASPGVTVPDIASLLSIPETSKAPGNSDTSLINPKVPVTPPPVGTPGVQIGPIVAQLDPKVPVTPPPVGTPGVQTGPIVAQLDPKVPVTPPPVGTPGVQIGPVVAQLDPKVPVTPPPVGTPGVQTGPIVAQLDPKVPVTPPPVGTPGVQTGPVVAQLDPKVINVSSTSNTSLPQVTAENLIEIAPRLRGINEARPKGTVTIAGAKVAATGGSVLATGQASTIIAVSPQNLTNPIQAQVTVTSLPVDSRVEKPDSKLQPLNSRPANPGDIALDTRVNIQGAEQDQSLKSLQAPDSSTPKTTSAAQHNTPRLDQASLAGFASAMAQRAQNGGTRFEIRLDPAALGKVQVKLEVSADNRVEAIVSTQRPEVLADLQRGADSLRRALNDAGFELGSGGLSFSLEQGSQGSGADHDRAFGMGTAHDNEPSESMDTALSAFAESEIGYGLTRVLSGRVDVKV